MTARRRVLVVGGSGFVGSAVVEAVRGLGHDAVAYHAPRLPPMDPTFARTVIRDSPHVLRCADDMTGFDAVVNAAGIAEATEVDAGILTAANAVLPGVLGAAVAACASPLRFVHVSSAAAQGRIAQLDDGPAKNGFSAYSRSKALGERLAIELTAGRCVLYRPPGVHAGDRAVTRALAALAASPLASVARPGTANSPQALLINVAAAVAFLATTVQHPPVIVSHPSEGLTTTSLLELLGGRKPHRLPAPLARSTVAALSATGRVIPRLSGQVRRIEMLWFGQRQAPSWLMAAGWDAPAGHDAWRDLGRSIRSSAPQHFTTRSSVA